MKTYSLFDAPLQVSGVPFFRQRRKLERLPREVIDQMPDIETYHLY